MNKRIKAIIGRYNECSACMSRNAAKVGTYAPLADAVITLDTKIAVIQQTMLEHEKNLKGIAVEKKAKRKVMAELADVLRLKVQAVALSHGNEADYVNANFTYSSIFRASSLGAINNAQIVYELANAVSAADKTQFMILPDDLEILDAAISKFSTLNVLRRSSVVIKQTTGEVLNDLIKNTSFYIRTTMSALMGHFKVNDKAFFSEWEHAKSIINPSAVHGQITGKVEDAVTEQPLAHVKITATDGTQIFEDMTDSMGFYRLPLNPEVWTVTYELPSYKKHEKGNIIVDGGERHKLNVKLEHLQPG